MKSLLSIFGVLTLMSYGVYAAQDSQKNSYDGWKNKPSEKFSDAEANFNAVKKMLKDRYVDSKISDDALYEAAIRGMLNSLNPSEKDDWNKLYSPDEFREFQNDIKGEVTGIGIEMKFNEDTGSASILKVIPGSAAESAGVHAGDQIISVDGKLYKGLQFRDLVYSIRGKVGETIKLKLLRGDSIVSKSVTREKFKWLPVEAAQLEDKVAYIKIHYFNEKSSALLKTALEKVKSNHSTALVIDLRDDEGGLFDQAVESASYFTPKGKIIVRVESRDGSEKKRESTQDPIIQNLPVAILISEKTSSGAELFAGSLGENIGAKLIGEKTHGKWSAQTLEKLNNGFAVKFTTELFKTPNGKIYQGIGLEPDVTVTNHAQSIQTSDPKELLEKDESVKTAFNLLNSSHS